MDGSSSPGSRAQSETAFNSIDTDTAVPQPLVYPGVQPSKCPDTSTAQGKESTSEAVVEAPPDLADRSDLQNTTSAYRKANAVPLPANPGAFQFPRPELRSGLSARQLQAPLDLKTPLKPSDASKQHRKAIPDGVSGAEQQLTRPLFLTPSSATGMDASPQEVLAVRKAAGEEYAKAILLTSATPRSHILGQLAHTATNLNSAHDHQNSWLKCHQRPTIHLAEPSRPDPAQCLAEGPDSPCLLQRTGLPLLQHGAVLGLSSAAHYGGSHQSSRPHSAGARYLRDHEHAKRANTSGAMLSGHIHQKPRSPSARPVQLQSQHRLPQSHPSNRVLPHRAPVSTPPLSQSHVRQVQDSEFDEQHRSTFAAAEMPASSPPASQRTRSVTDRLINPAEIEMSIRRLHSDRSPDHMGANTKVDFPSLSAMGISRCGTEASHSRSSSKAGESMDDSERRRDEVSLRGGIADAQVKSGSSSDAVGLKRGPPPFTGRTSCWDLSEDGGKSSIPALDVGDPVHERSTHHELDCQGMTQQQAKSACTSRHDAACSMRSGASAERCSGSVAAKPCRLSVIEAYSRLGVPCPGHDAPALQPWDVNAWKSAWTGSGVIGSGRAGLWTLEAVSCIVWDRREAFREQRQPMLDRLQELQRDLQEELRTVTSAKVTIRPRKKPGRGWKKESQRQWVGGSLSPTTANRGHAVSPKRSSNNKQCGTVLEAIEESEFKRKLLVELIHKIRVGLCFSAMRHAAQEVKLINSILQHVDGSRSLVHMQLAVMGWRDVIFHGALREAQALTRFEERRLKLLREVFDSWNRHAHEQGWHRRHVGQSLATIALNMLRSSMRHWQLAVAKQNLKFQANAVAMCFRGTRLKMVAFHAWCQNTAERCQTRANQQTVLRALRLASENVPGQQSSLAAAKSVTAQCAFGLRFSATEDDVYWAANIRRFVQSPFDDPLFNSIIVQGTRKPRQWMQHGGLEASFLKHPPVFLDDEPVKTRYVSKDLICVDSRAAASVSATACGHCQVSQADNARAHRAVGRHNCAVVSSGTAVAADSELRGLKEDHPANSVTRHRTAHQRLTASAAAKAKPGLCDKKNRICSKLKHPASGQDAPNDSGSSGDEFSHSAQQRGRHFMEDLESNCMDEALASGAFSALVKDCAALPVAGDECIKYHTVCHSLPAQRIADQLVEARRLQEKVSEISEKSSQMQQEAGDEEDADSRRLDLAMSHASRASMAADAACDEHKQAVAALDSSRQWLLQLQDVKDREAEARRVAADELTAKRSELSVLHARLAAASQQQQSQLATGATQAAARVIEAKQEEQAIHADLMEAARKEREARQLQLDLQTQADGLLDKYILLCAKRSPDGVRVMQQETPEGAAVKVQLQCHRDKADEAARLVQDLCKFRSSLQDAHNTAVSEVQALEQGIRQQNTKMATAETQHEDASLKCSQLHEQLLELEKQAGHVTDLEQQYKAALQNVAEAEERESLARKALLQTKQLAADATAAAHAVQETVGSRRNARLMTIDVLSAKRQRLESELQHLQQAIVEAPAAIVNQAVVIFHQQQADEPQNEVLHQQRTALPVATVAAACVNPELTSAAGPLHADSRRRPGNVAELHAANWPQQPAAPAALTLNGPTSPASVYSSGSDSLQEAEGNAAPPWRLLHLSYAPCSRHQSASQFFVRKLTLRALQSWRQLIAGAHELAHVATQHDRTSCVQRALQRWGRVTSNARAWRSQQLRAAMTQRAGAVMARALFGWQTFVIQQQESLHRFLTIRFAHARRLQKTALQALCEHAMRKRRARELVHVARLQAARRLLWSWRSVVTEAQDLRAKALLVFATRTHRQLKGLIRAWHAVTAVKRGRRQLQFEFTRKRRHRHLAEAVKLWRDRCDHRCLLRRVFGQAEKAWAVALQEEQERDATVFVTVFRAWVSHVQILRERRVQTVQNARAAAFNRQSIIRRALQAWIAAVRHEQQLASVRSLRDVAFRLWRGRARDKSAAASTVSARMKLKSHGWANEFQYHSRRSCQKYLAQWTAPRRYAEAHRQRVLLHKSILGFSQGVYRTQQLLAPHHEYWRQGVPLLKAWRAWTSVTQMKRYIRAEREWVRQAARQLLLSKVLRSWVGLVRYNRHEQALAVAAHCHRSDALLGRAVKAWKQAHHASRASSAKNASHLSPSRNSRSSAWKPRDTRAPVLPIALVSCPTDRRGKVAVHKNSNVVVGRLRKESKKATIACKSAVKQGGGQDRRKRTAISRTSSSDCDSLAMWLDA